MSLLQAGWGSRSMTSSITHSDTSSPTEDSTPQNLHVHLPPLPGICYSSSQ